MCGFGKAPIRTCMFSSISVSYPQWQFRGSFGDAQYFFGAREASLRSHDRNTFSPDE